MFKDRTNSELLAYDGDQIGSLEKQRRYVLRTLIAKKACPNCATPQNFFEAAGVDVDSVDLTKGESTNIPTHCAKCKRELNRVQPLFGDWEWSLVPVKVD